MNAAFHSPAIPHSDSFDWPDVLVTRQHPGIACGAIRAGSGCMI